MDTILFHSNHLCQAEHQTFHLEMDDANEKQLQSTGICHRLFCFIMKTLAAQALKPVTLGPPLPSEPTQRPVCSALGQLPQPPVSHAAMASQSRSLIEEDEDLESLASIDIEDATYPQVEAGREGSCQDEEKISVEMMGESERRAPRKMVSIKDEPEIIYFGNKRRKRLQEKQISSLEREQERELRPLRSILKVGSNLGETSAVDVKPKKKVIMD